MRTIMWTFDDIGGARSQHAQNNVLIPVQPWLITTVLLFTTRMTRSPERWQVIGCQLC